MVPWILFSLASLILWSLPLERLEPPVARLDQPRRGLLEQTQLLHGKAGFQVSFECDDALALAGLRLYLRSVLTLCLCGAVSRTLDDHGVKFLPFAFAWLADDSLSHDLRHLQRVHGSLQLVKCQLFGGCLLAVGVLLHDCLVHNARLKRRGQLDVGVRAELAGRLLVLPRLPELRVEVLPSGQPLVVNVRVECGCAIHGLVTQHLEVFRFLRRLAAVIWSR